MVAREEEVMLRTSVREDDDTFSKKSISGGGSAQNVNDSASSRMVGQDTDAGTAYGRDAGTFNSRCRSGDESAREQAA